MRIIIFLLFSICLCACTKQDQFSESKKPDEKNILAPCPSFAETGKPALVYGAQCGEIIVKENPADATSRDISIAILRLPAISPVAKQDPLFLIQGGPGGSSIAMAEMVHYAFEDVRKNRDLIFIDQRGTGKSNPLNCEHLSDADEQLSEEDATQKNNNLLKNCAEKYKQQAPFYTTPYAAQDLDAVRRALGYPVINVWGVSYGTRVALEYVREFPQQTRSIILDGVAPVQIALPKYFQQDAMTALNAINNECAAQEKCKKLFGNLIENAAQVSEHLAQLQVTGKTLDIEFEHPRYHQLTHVVLTSKQFSQLIFMSLYSRDLTVLLPHAIANAAKDDYRLIAALWSLASEQSTFLNISDAMRYSITCNEDAHFISQDDIAKAQPFFGFNMLQEFAEICAFWPKAHLPDNYFEPVKSDTPALILSGDHDPVTPSHWADTVKQHLTHSLAVVAPGGNHSISMEGCAPRIIAQFIEMGKVDGIKTDCIKKIMPLPLVLGANEQPSSVSTSSSGNVLPAAPSPKENDMEENTMKGNKIKGGDGR